MYVDVGHRRAALCRKRLDHGRPLNDPTPTKDAPLPQLCGQVRRERHTRGKLMRRKAARIDAEMNLR